MSSKKAAGYVRVSTEDQVEKYGLDVQREEIERYAQQNGFELYRIFEDPGISGSEMNRPGLQEMLSLAVTNPELFKTVIIYKTDRLARDNFMAWWIEKELKKASITLISVTEPYRLDDPSGRLFYAMVSAFADYERSVITMRTKSGRLRKAKEGGFAGGNLSLGYEIKEGKLIINEQEAALVRRIYKEYLWGRLSLRQIAHLLKAEGVQTKENGNWWPSTIREILSNPLYAGSLHYSAVKASGEHEPIVPRNWYLAAKKKQRYPFKEDAKWDLN